MIVYPSDDLAVQLTPSRRATKEASPYNLAKEISTHALTEGDDKSTVQRTLYCISTHALTEGDWRRTEDDYL